MKSATFLLGLLCVAGTASAQQAVPATLSLADALRIARDHNPTYRQAENNRAPAAWGTRNAFASLVIPQVTASGSLGYSGTGSQRFLTSNFSQTYATVSSNYSIGFDWTLSGTTLSQPGLRRAELTAADGSAMRIIGRIPGEKAQVLKLLVPVRPIIDARSGSTSAASSG